MKPSNESHLGEFLKDKRQRLDPLALGYSAARRRTPGLRREEVAARANISVTWYTWLEQGRGGTPSGEVLGRIAKALLLSSAETEYLFLTTLGRAPESNYQLKAQIAPRLQQILDALSPNPALIRNLTWDVLAWNQAAACVLTDYEKLAGDERNILKLFFLRHEVRLHNPDWRDTARLLVSAFRADIARLGENQRTADFIADLCKQSAEFKELWCSHEVNEFTAGVKTLHNPSAGELNLAYSSFSVSGSPELSLVVYTPIAEQDQQKIADLVSGCP